jgi:diphthamide biosynthesis enzyme Dph1/Dph2-like protein
MKVLHIETRKKLAESDLNLSSLDELSQNKSIKTISIASTIQYLDLLPIVQKYFSDKKIKVLLKKGSSVYTSQVLGCNADAFDKHADALLLLADGKFHAKNNAILLQREIFVFNGEKLEKITKQELEKYLNDIKGKKNKFLSYNIIGILVSTKQGQHYNSIKQLTKKLEKLNKNVYVFESDTINIAELENFPNIKLWVNTACPGLSLDYNNIVNLRDIENLL